MQDKIIVCLANSTRPGGRCLAGKEWNNGAPGEWIRPISRPNRGLAQHERLYRNGHEPEILDLIKVPCVAPQPLQHQRENWRISPGGFWDRVGRIEFDQVERLLDYPDTLFANGYHSSIGRNNIVPPRLVTGRSLYLLAVDVVILAVVHGKLMARFQYRNDPYCLHVTDPVIQEEVDPDDEDEYPLRDAVLCVSLGEEFKGYHYKLVATVLYRERFR